MKHSEVVKLNEVIWEKTPEELIRRTENYWKMWVKTSVGGIARYTNDFITVSVMIQSMRLETRGLSV